MINRAPLFKDLNIWIPSIIPIKGRGFINQGSGLSQNIQPSSPKVRYSRYRIIREPLQGLGFRVKGFIIAMIVGIIHYCHGSIVDNDKHCEFRVWAAGF